MPEHVFFDDLAPYALGALTTEESAGLERHLSDGCVACDMELASLSAVVANLPYAIPAVHVPPGLRKRVLRGIAPRFPWYETLGIAALVVLAAGVSARWVSVQTDLTTARSRTAALELQVKAQQTQLAWLRDPRVQIALMKGLEATSPAKAKMLWHPGTGQALLYIAGLPPLPLDKSYELWVFAKDEPLRAGIFDTRDGSTVVSMPRLEALPPSATKFAVSVEPKGGVSKPTGSIVLLGESL
jgi:anti-sigma-K factor RskA